jgi:pyruvate, orthophosphate dikinase
MSYCIKKLTAWCIILSFAITNSVSAYDVKTQTGTLRPLMSKQAGVMPLSDSISAVSLQTDAAMGDIDQIKSDIMMNIEHLESGLRTTRISAVRNLGAITSILTSMLAELSEDEGKSHILDEVLDLILVTLTPALMEVLKNDVDPKIRYHAVSALGSIRPFQDGVILVLADAVADRDIDVRHQAIAMLSDAGSEASLAMPALIKALKDREAQVRSNAAWALGRVGSDASEAIPALLDALKYDSSPYVRGDAAEALGKVARIIDQGSAIDRLLTYLGKEAGELSYSARVALQEALGDKDRYVQEQARYALMTDAKFSSAGEATDKTRLEEQINSSIEGLKSPDTSTRRLALERLADIGTSAEKAIPYIIMALLNDGNVYVRMYAARALGRIGPLSDEVIPALVNALKDSYYVNRESVEALKKICPAAAYVLYKSLDDADAAYALGATVRLYPEIIPPFIHSLQKELKGNDESRKHHAAYVLGEIGPAASESVDDLLYLLNNKFENIYARSAAAEALGKIDPNNEKVIENLKQAFEEKNYLIKKRAAEALAQGIKTSSSGDSLVYMFAEGKTTAEELFNNLGLDARKAILGGKGEGLHSMTAAGIPVPPGFTIITEACNYYYAKGVWPAELDVEINKHIEKIEDVLGKGLGDAKNPLLLSVRSGAKFSMPGMMDTILNLGLNDESVLGFASITNNERLAWDSYRRFIQMFSNVVLGIDKEHFDKIMDAKKLETGAKSDLDLTTDDLKDIAARFKSYLKEIGMDFPQDAKEQLRMAVNAVFLSWNSDRAKYYRSMNNISDALGTAVNVQAMVFGNSGNASATGVGFTRNPSTGEKIPYGEFLVNAQGEDVVAGIRTPNPISELEEAMPDVYRQLIEITSRLEVHYRDMQDFEFTIENGKLYLLQTRSGKRTGVAAVKIAVDMVHEGRISRQEALMRLSPQEINEVLFPMVDPNDIKSLSPQEILTTGLSAGPGGASGRIVFSSKAAVERAERGEKVILWRKETSPDDIEGMHRAQGVGTSAGGMTSHAAVVARQMGKVTMVGASNVEVDEAGRKAVIKDDGGVILHTLNEGDWVTLNVVSGKPAQLILGEKNIVRPEELSSELEEFLSWAREHSRLYVRANADTPEDARKAFGFGAQGIGLCRTEHMFFAPERLPIMQEVILAKNLTEREIALDKLLPMQRGDFAGLFREMKGFPVTIRMLDPPLHEFLPKREELMVDVRELEVRIELANEMPRLSSLEQKQIYMNKQLLEKKRTLLARVNELHEFNPMMGLRGVRLGIMMPEITAMQARAIAEAASEVVKEGKDVLPEIMIPLVGKLEELAHQKKIIVDTVEQVMKEQGITFEYKVGTMIEIPRAALTADELAGEAEFFSFGTNDLTQYGAGFSRDDAGKYLQEYQKLGIYINDPFESLDTDGIGKLIEIAVEKGRITEPGLKIGICGEHGGDPASIEFFHKTGLDYVSCSPYRVLGAWLAAAQSAIKDDQVKASSAGTTLTERDLENIKLAAEAARLSDAKGTVVYNDTMLSVNQQQALQSLIGIGTQGLTELELKLGCKVRLLSQGPVEDNTDTIIISDNKLPDYTKAQYLVINQVNVDLNDKAVYVAIFAHIPIAKGLLGLKSISQQPELYEALKQSIRNLSQGLLNEREVEQAIEAYINGNPLFIELPPAVSYEGKLENLQRAALMALIAA